MIAGEGGIWESAGAASQPPDPGTINCTALNPDDKIVMTLVCTLIMRRRPEESPGAA